MAEEKTARRLFVGGLYDGITDKDLSDRFSRFGEVSGVDIRARKDNLGNILKTFAYLNMTISEKDYKKCMATFNKTTWRGNEMQIQLAKESFMDRLAREREAAKIQESCPPVKPVVEPVNLQVKGAPPGTAVEGKQDWVVGKYGRALPVVNIRTKNKKKVLKIDPSKYVHGVKKFDHSKKADTVETDPSPSVNGLTWHLDVEETETLKRIKGEFPKTKKTPQKRKHSLGDDSINIASPGTNGKGGSLSMKAYHSNSDSGTSDDEKPQITKKKKFALKSDIDSSLQKPSIVVQTPLANGKRKRTISDTSSPHDGKDTRSRAISPNISVIEPQANGTPTKVQKPSALDILKRLKMSSQKKVVDVKKCVSNNEGSKVTSSKPAADNGLSKTVKVEDKSPVNYKSTSTTKSKNLSSSVSETEKTSWSPSIDVGSVEQSNTPKATDILQKLKLASQRKQNVETTPVSTKRGTSESIGVGTDKQGLKTQTPNATDILEKLKRKQNLDTTPTSRKVSTPEASSVDVLPSKETVQKANKKSNVKLKSNKEDLCSSSDSEEEVNVRQSNKKSKSPKVPALLTMETETQGKAPQKSKKLKLQKNAPTANTVKLIQFDDDIGVDADDEEGTSNIHPKRRQHVLRRNPTIAQPAFAQVGSVDEFGVGMLVDEKTRPLSEEERKWQKYNSHTYSSDEDILDAAKAGSFSKLERMAKLAQLGQKHIEIPTALSSNSDLTTAPKVYNSDSNSDDENFKRVQTMPKRTKLKSMPPKIKNTQNRKQQKQKSKSSDLDDTSSEDDVTTAVEQKKLSKDNSSTSKRKLLEDSKQPESSESSSMCSASDPEEVVTGKTNGGTEKSSTNSSESSAEEVEPVGDNSSSPPQKNSESSSDSSESEAEEVTNKSPVQKVKASENVSNTKHTAQVNKHLGDTSESSSESNASSDEELKEGKQKPEVQSRKEDSPVNKKRPQKGDTPKSSSESSTSSSDEEAEVKQKPQVLTTEDGPVVSQKEVQKEDSSTSSSESSTSSEDEEVTQVKQKPQVVQSKNIKTPVSKKRASKEESSSESCTSADDEKVTQVKQKPQVVQSKNIKTPVSKKRASKEESSSESSTSSDDEKITQVKQKPQVVQSKNIKTPVSKKLASKEESSSESSTSSDDEEVTQVKQKPQVVQSKKSNSPLGKKNASKEESSSSESSASSDEEPTQSNPAAEKRKLPKESEEPRSGTTKAPAPVSQVPVKAKASDTLKVKPDKPKVIKSKEAINQQRLESLKQRHQEAWAQKNLLKKALASVDANSSNSNKIRFDSESEDEKMKMQDSSSSSESDSGNDSDTESSDEESQPKRKKKTATTKPSLFDEDSAESEDDTEDQFRVRPQFEGEAGSKLIALQSRFGNDPRFKFTEKFLDSDNEAAQDSNAEEEMEVTEDSTAAERNRTLAILKDVVGQADSKTKKTKAVLFKDMATQQYDPTKDEHKQFEVQVEKKEKKKKKKEVQVVPEAEALPQVSGDRYFEVQNSLKDMFTKTDDKPFSLLAMLGKTEDEPAPKGFSQQADGKGQVFQHIKSPWQQQFGSDGESSGDEHGDMEHDNTSALQSEAGKGTKHKPDSTSSRGSHGFFFIDNDPRIAEGINFFRRQEDIEQIREKWAQERPDLVEAYRNKRKRFRFMKKEGTTPNYKAGFKPRGGKRGGGRGRR